MFVPLKAWSKCEGWATFLGTFGRVEMELTGSSEELIRDVFSLINWTCRLHYEATLVNAQHVTE